LGISPWPSHQQAAVVRALLSSYKLDVNPNIDRFTPLHLVAVTTPYANLNLPKILLPANRVNRNPRYYYGRTALNLDARCRIYDAVKILID
jgi:hypothetical protein